MEKFLSQPKSRKIAVILALLGVVTPVCGLHKFYMGQWRWGIVYLLLFVTPIARIACGIELLWYLVQDSDEFSLRFNQGIITKPKISTTNGQEMISVAEAVRELDKLRQEGLMSEYEFEQKRRQLLALNQ